MSIEPRRARRNPPTDLQLYLWSIGCIQADIARGAGYTPRAITAMLTGSTRINPNVIEWLRSEYGEEAADKTKTMGERLWDAHPVRIHNRTART